VERTGKDVELGSLGLSERLPSEIETTLYRVVQEALNNVEKHSQATKVILLLSQEGSLLTVSMKDDGRGFDPILVERREAEERGLGLSNIKERVGFVGGTSAIRSSPGCGVEILIKIPLNG
jgi:two-component system NarL family sensor kinase